MKSVASSRIRNLRALIGAVLAVVGLFMLLVVGGIEGFTNASTWAIGLALLIGGLLLAKSAVLIRLVSEITRF